MPRLGGGVRVRKCYFERRTMYRNCCDGAGFGWFRVWVRESHWVGVRVFRAWLRFVIEDSSDTLTWNYAL